MPAAFRPGALLLDLYTASNLSGALLDRELALVGVDGELIGLLTEIRLAEPITPTALAARTGYRPTTLSDYVQRLLDRGDVARRDNPGDRRSYLLSVTEAGLARIHASSEAVRRVNHAIADRSGRSLPEFEQVVWELRTALESALAAG
jgi:DNA-binding MarR family transcriptional regulator